MKNIVKSPSKHYSPLRYPGGKASLSNFLSNVIQTNKIKKCTYVEPYAGGAGAALTMLVSKQVDRIVINDFDKAIYSIWRSILDHKNDFIDKIKSTEVTIDEWHRQREIYRNKKSRQLDLGFAAFFLNRTNRSGIIEGGPIGGSSQSGKWLVDARYNKTGLIDRIKTIAAHRSRIEVTNRDGIELLTDIYKEKNQFVYLDPPYYIKGSCLYLNHYEENSHEKLAQFLNEHNNFYWILTYDNVSQIKKLYSDRRHYKFNLNYHIDLPKIGRELLVISDKIAYPKKTR
jgi:DNA adenine methylase